MQDNELEGARNADIDTDTDVELGLNVDMSEFEGDKDVEAEALHDEEDEELAQAAFELQQPDALDNDIDAMVGSMDEDTQDPIEAFADQGTADACARPARRLCLQACTPHILALGSPAVGTAFG